MSGQENEDAFDPGEFIAIRRLVLTDSPSQEVLVGIKIPVLHGADFRCGYRIFGIGSGRTGHARGIDSLHALHNALLMAGTDLYLSEPAQRGVLTWEGSRNLGFPVPDGAADLVPKE